MREPRQETVTRLACDGSGPTGGHLACRGCGGVLAMQMAARVLGPNCVFVIPAGCMAVIDGPFPLSSLQAPLLHIAFEAAASAAAGVRAGLDARGKHDTTVVAWAGDGATFDIGFGAVSAAADRNDNVLYVCYDNEAYMNTGIQQSGATPAGAWTTTTPRANPKPTPKKDMLAIMTAHRIPYFASATPAFPDDYLAKLERARDTRGFRFLHVFTPCPPGQRFEEQNTVRVARKAVTSRVFPLVEVAGGKALTVFDAGEPTPVREYVRLQGRFSHLDDGEVERFAAEVDARWRWLIDWAERESDE
ncbi:MAG: Pyruvate synthase subunit PorB [Calditrichaeota bacterium]|nr:Pyruvate synthase subunit PorB [Calditrichota bacterium]